MRSRAILAGAVAVVMGGGCQTAVGNYFANRARDFGECWRVQVGAPSGIGVGVRAAGLAHLGAAVFAAGIPRDVGIGWVYALLVGARVGFSPGEFLDFLLGWFGLDLAGDDTPLPPSASRP